jgi:hypothetical protein
MIIDCAATLQACYLHFLAVSISHLLQLSHDSAAIAASVAVRPHTALRTPLLRQIRTE